jgi:uncharacterized pyridoxal phosphate-containing UPF0001 family protein
VGDRLAEIAAGLAATRRRIALACDAAGRDPADVTLVVVTKTFPATDVRLLNTLGVRDVGENRHPEAGEKAESCADLDLRWHFIGQIQTNKANAVASYADVVHSVDRVRLVTALARGRTRPAPLECLIQVSLDDPEAARGRGGASPADVATVSCGCAVSWRWPRWGRIPTRPSRGWRGCTPTCGRDGRRPTGALPA